ncbi:MAG TPA: hypothetical protein VK184_09670 [Nostocaceae cyanobacterium]|nr:hypothetical protein [Nostocaceae cyanobacterium]
MSNQDKIEKIYQEYLESQLDAQIAKHLGQILHNIGLQNEAKLLTAYFDQGIQKIDNFQTDIWGQRRCFIGKFLPENAEIGDIWFDIVELTPMILIPSPYSPLIEMREWVSIRPVYTWQFRTFLNLVKWHLIKEYFMNVPDLMDNKRFESINAMEFITNIYHEEAAAYAHWFGKQLTGQFTLEATREFAEPEQFFQILPPNFRLWDGAEYSGSEFVRIAVSQETIDKDAGEIDEELEMRESKQNQILNNRVLFEEWEYKSNIGLGTAIPLQIELIKEIPRLAYEFIELTNAAPRS